MADNYSKEKRREYNHTYYMKHRDKEIERAKKYQKENRERMTAISKERRHRSIEEQEKNRERARAWYRNNKKRFIDYRDGYKKDNPDKVFATKEINKAIDRGDITRQPCEICGDHKTDAHHDDYNYPMQVRWLCRRHHREWHLHNEPIRRSL